MIEGVVVAQVEYALPFLDGADCGILIHNLINRNPFLSWRLLIAFTLVEAVGVLGRAGDELFRHDLSTLLHGLLLSGGCLVHVRGARSRLKSCERPLREAC